MTTGTKKGQENISFQQFHEPQLKSGDYTIEVTQTVSQATKDPGSPTTVDTFSDKKRIFVAGERFTIPQNQVYSCFPPQGNNGDHSHDLPSIMLNRSTLPWERYAQEGGSLTMPWLYLFVFDDDDIKKGNVKASSKDTKDVVHFTGDGSYSGNTKIVLDQEPGEVTTAGLNPAKVNVVEIKASWAEQFNILPTIEDLGLMTGVRVNTKEAPIVIPGDATAKVVTVESPDSELAICIANRLPAQGVKTYAHLLSLEGRVVAATAGSGAEKAKPERISLSSQGVNDDYCSFISLYNWSFTCTAGSKETFTELLNKLHANNLGLPKLTNTDSKPDLSTANKYLQKGAVALPHHLKEGGTAVSWYHGPMVGGSGDINVSGVQFPVQQSDDLLLLDTTLSMLNTSYAAAWELGRMLTLNNKAMSMDMYAWKRQLAWEQNATQADQQFKDLQPANKRTALKKGKEDQWSKIQAWLESLLLLENVPFNYLLPDETLLPAESIRFFEFDQLWISSLLDGAYSIGRVSPNDAKTESAAAAAGQTAIETVISKYDKISGFLLRSQVVSGWPALEVESPTAKPSDANPDPTILPLLRMDHLGPDILLCLFKGDASYFDIHLKPESIHFGFQPADPPTQPDRYKEIRFKFPATGVEQVADPTTTTTPIVWRKYNTAPGGKEFGTDPNPARSVDLKTLNGKMYNVLYGPPKNGKKQKYLSPPEFAMEMVKGVPRVFFTIPGNVKKGKLAPLTGTEYKYHAPPVTVEKHLFGGSQDGGGTTGDYINPKGFPGPGGGDGDFIGGIDGEFIQEGDSSQQAKDKDATAGTTANQEKMKENVQNPEFNEENQQLQVQQGAETKTSDIEKVIEKLESEFPKASADLKDFLKHKKEAAQGLDPKEKGSLKYDIKKAIGEIKDLEPEVTEEVKEKLDEIKDKIEASPLLNMNSAKVRKAWVIGTLALLLVSTILWTVSTIVDRERPNPLVFHFQGVKEMQEIEFVKQDYEELVPIATKDGELEFLLTVPASVSGKMDMTMMEYEVEGDTVIKVTLPNPIVSDPVLNLAEVKDYYDRGGGDKLFLSGGGASYSKAYEQIISSMDNTKKGILANAVKDDIIEETNKKARAYLINMAGAIGYRIEFVLKEPDPTWEDDMKKRLGKTYDKVKNKVEGHSGIFKRIKDDLTRKKI